MRIRKPIVQAAYNCRRHWLVTNSLMTADPNWEPNPVNNEHVKDINASQSLRWDTPSSLYYLQVLKQETSNR